MRRIIVVTAIVLFLSSAGFAQETTPCHAALYHLRVACAHYRQLRACLLDVAKARGIFIFEEPGGETYILRGGNQLAKEIGDRIHEANDFVVKIAEWVEGICQTEVHIPEFCYDAEAGPAVCLLN